MSYIGSLIIERSPSQKAEIASDRVKDLWIKADELLPLVEKAGTRRFQVVDLGNDTSVEILETTVHSYNSLDRRTRTTVTRAFSFDRGDDTFFSVTLRMVANRFQIASGIEHFAELEKELRSAGKPSTNRASTVR